MTPPRSRRLAFALLAMGTLAIAQTAPGQNTGLKDPFQKKEPAVSGEVRGRVNEMRDGKRPFTKGEAEDANRKDLKNYAEFLIWRVTSKDVHSQLEPVKNELRPLNATDKVTMHALLVDLERFIVVPTSTTRVPPDQADYIRVFGEELDKAIAPILNPNAPDYIRVNATRMLATVAKSGAKAHAPTILKLLDPKNTRPEMLFYAIRAAENLLAAYEPFSAGTATYYRHTVDDPTLFDLVRALEEITKWEQVPFAVTGAAIKPAPAAAPVPPTPVPPTPPALAPKTAAAPAKPAMPLPPAGRIDNASDAILTSDQLGVLHYYRRAAIRALAQVRVPIIVHPGDKGTLYPVIVLGKFAVDDASLKFAPTPDEAAEAAIGLAGYHNFKGIEIESLLDAIAGGLVTFARAKANAPEDKTLAWKIYAARLGMALAEMRKVAANNPTLLRYSAKIDSLANIAANEILNVIEKPVANRPPNVAAISSWKARSGDGPLTLITDDKTKILTPQLRQN